MEPEGSLPRSQDPATGPYPEPDESILILCTDLSLGVPSVLLSFGFPTKILYTFLISSMHANCHAHLILLDLITQIMSGEAYYKL
jgi:hypothetical protein